MRRSIKRAKPWLKPKNFIWFEISALSSFFMRSSWTKGDVMKIEDELLTGDELCQKLKIKKSFLYAPARRKGPDAIPCVRIGKYLRYDLQAVQQWILRQNQDQAV
jgi:predicted DNA-binding transcriptional regulator AlpA